MMPDNTYNRSTHLEHPVASVKAFPHRRHLNKFYRRDNLADAKSLGDNVIDFPNEGLIIPFSKEVLNFLDLALENEGLPEYSTNTEITIDPWFVRAIALRDAHALSSWNELAERLAEEEEISQIIYENAPRDNYSGNYIGQKAKTAEQIAIHTGEDTKELRVAISNAAWRTVEACYRHGLILPSETVEKYDLDMTGSVDAADISRRTKRYARWNWVETILNPVLEPIDFGRSNWSYSIQSFFGLLAHSAGTNQSITNIQGNIPVGCSETGPVNINETIGTLSKETIQEQFEEAHIRLIKFAQEEGIITGGQSIAFDPTHVSSRTNDEQPTVDTGSERAYFYPVTAIVDEKPRLILGVHHIPEKSLQTKKLLKDIRNLSNHIDISELVLDGDFHSSDAIKHARRDSIEVSIIRCNPSQLAEEVHPVNDVGWLEPYHAERWQTDVQVDDVKTELVWYKRKTSDSAELLGFLLPKMEEEIEAKDIYQKYKKRTRIETTFKQLKKSFRASTDPEQTEVELFYMHTAVLFYNIYILMNGYYSPKLLLRLDPTPENVLTAIRDVCLDCGDNPT